jgi:hypothetical protein
MLKHRKSVLGSSPGEYDFIRWETKQVEERR